MPINPANPPTRFPLSGSLGNTGSGVTNAAEGTTLGMMGQPDPTLFHTFFDDFDNFEADQWVITTTEAGAGSATEAVADADGGILVITNDAADDDADFFQWSGDDDSGACETWKFVVGKRLWFKARFKVSDATQSDFVIGLQITDTTPLAVTDGVYFQKDDGDANLDINVTKNSTTTTAVAATVVNDTYLTVGFYYDGGPIGSGVESGRVHYFINDVLKGSLVTTNLVDDEELTISFGIQNGEAVAKVMSLDYIFVAKER